MAFYELPRVRYNTSAWSQPHVAILSAPDADELTQQLNVLIEHHDVHVLAFSAAQIIATYVENPWTSTVILQEKVDPLMNGASS